MNTKLWLPLATVLRVLADWPRFGLAEVKILLLATRLDGYAFPRLSVVEVAESWMNRIG